jgi:hypothetical protein
LWKNRIAFFAFFVQMKKKSLRENSRRLEDQRES